MARQITINSYDQNTGNLAFTVTGAANNQLNRSYTVNNMPVDSANNLMAAIRFYLQAYKDGLQAAKRATADTSVTAIVGQAQTDEEG